jgi:hypothetical protein
VERAYEWFNECSGSINAGKFLSGSTACGLLNSAQLHKVSLGS